MACLIFSTAFSAVTLSGFVRPSIGQALAANSLQRIVGALGILNAEFRAVVITEVKLREIAMQMLRPAMMINASQAALENREEVFERVSVHVAARPLKLGMVNAFVLGILKLVVLRAVRQQAAGIMKHLRRQELAHRLAVKVDRTQIAATFHKAQNLTIRLRVQRSRLAGLRRLGEESLVSLNRLAGAAQRASVRRRGHCFTQ